MVKYEQRFHDAIVLFVIDCQVAIFTYRFLTYPFFRIAIPSIPDCWRQVMDNAWYGLSHLEFVDIGLEFDIICRYL